MQKVAAYLLERRDGMEWHEARANEAKRLQSEVTKWLTSKGASGEAATGTYQPEDGSKGAFAIEEASDGERTWWMLQLREDTNEGRRFSVALSITCASDRVSVYVTLETGWATTRIMPVSVDPRCPRVVRSLLSLPGRWYHGASTLRQRQTVKGFEDGEALAAEIQHPNRTVPFVVVSTDRGKVVLPELDAKLSYDLAGLANVVVIDEDAAWALTDILGQPFCCYWGAVRLYWPHFSTNQDRFFHPLWTAERLRSTGYDAIETRDRFRKQMRGLLFRAAALSVIRPREIDDIRDAAGLRAVTELRQRATSLEEYEKLADSYATENDQLRAERTNLRSQVEQLEAQIAKLESDRQALLTHLRAAKAAPAEPEVAASTDTIEPGAGID
jgi:outer membrane murein-binding lipoprotein Lpp